MLGGRGSDVLGAEMQQSTILQVRSLSWHVAEFVLASWHGEKGMVPPSLSGLIIYLEVILVTLWGAATLSLVGLGVLQSCRSGWGLQTPRGWKEHQICGM